MANETEMSRGEIEEVALSEAASSIQISGTSRSTNMTLRDYATGGRDLYGRYAEAVRGILLACLARHPEIKHQDVQARAKTIDSLTKKLGDHVVTKDVQGAVKDLAGVRIVLYTDGDLDRLDAAALITENFAVEWGGTKFHYPVGKDSQASYFIGRNYVVRLNEARVALPEYADFAGLRCEVQVQTILQHAWSETAHDTIYKSPDFGAVGARNVAALKAQMNAIQRKYLIPAGHEFQKILNAFERLASGRQLVDAGVLEAIEKAENNNTVCDLIDRFRDFVLPEIDEPKAWAPDIRRAAISAIAQASGRPVTPVETPYGELPGKALKEVVTRAAGLINGLELRFIDPTETLQSLIAMFRAAAGDEDARAAIVESAGELAKHNLYAWRHAGPFVQHLLMETIDGLDPKEADAVRPLLLEVARNVLDTEVVGTSSDSKSVTWTRGSVVVSDVLNKVRDRAIAVIEDTFLAACDDGDRRRAFSAYLAASNVPHVGVPSDDLIIRVRRDTVRMIQFLMTHATDVGNPLLQSIEDAIHLRYRWNWDTKEMEATKPAVAEAGRDVADAAFAFRDHVAGFEDYGIFKVLVGFEAVFDEAWDALNFGAAHKLNEEARTERAAELLGQVTVESAPEWFERLDRYAATESNDLATFPRLGQFIADILKTHPSLGPIWLDQAQGRAIGDFTSGMLRGLYEAAPEAATAWVDRAIMDEKALASVARFLNHSEPPLPDRVARMARVALRQNDIAAVRSVLEFAVRRLDVLGEKQAIAISLAMVEFLVERSDSGWKEAISFYSRDGAFVSALGDADRQRLLVALSELRQIDYHAEQILAMIAPSRPAEVVRMFGRRIEIESAQNRDVFGAKRYEAIPFRFQTLTSAIGSDAVNIVLEGANLSIGVQN